MSGTLVVLVLYAVWGFGGFALVGFPGYARADRLEQIERKQDIQLRISLATEICRLAELRMTAPTLELYNILNGTLEQRQNDYAAVNRGRTYSLDQCSRFQPPR